MSKVVAISLAFIASACNQGVEAIRQSMIGPTHAEFVLVVSLKPPMAFGSGHKAIRLYSAEAKLVDEARFGEFPLEIEKWTNEQIVVLVDVSGATSSDYVHSWTSKNSKLGSYRLVYRFSTRAPASAK